MRYNTSKNSFIPDFYVSISYYLRVIVSKVFFGFLICLSLLLVIYGRNNQEFQRNVRDKIFLISKPQLFIIDSINMTFTQIGSVVDFLSNLYKINVELKRKNFDLMVASMRLNVLVDENEELKKLLNLVLESSIDDYVIKKINIMNNRNFIKKMQINISEEDGIEENDMVIDTDGNFVGRIVSIDENSAEVLLVTDTSSKTPARLDKSKIKVVLEGNKRKRLKINYFLGEKFNIKDGELVFTSGDGNIIDDGILIGKIVRSSNGEYMVNVESNLDKINYVIVLKSKTIPYANVL
ncbi:MAG: rod shape-determining protein MreC [Rickettsiales bacterium]|nr:rod shape-determining protein MreC [Rickettsiales bacterium]